MTIDTISMEDKRWEGVIRSVGVARYKNLCMVINPFTITSDSTKD
jgi:hypothetical protein